MHSTPVVVVFACSDEYVKYLSATMLSLLNTSSSERQYRIAVIEQNISIINKKKLKTLVNAFPNIGIEFVRAPAFLQNSLLDCGQSRISEETYYRVFIPWVLSFYDRAISIDCDMIITHDVAELFEIDLKDNLVGAVRDIVAEGEAADFKLGKWIYVERMLKLKRPYRIFNGGLTLLDLKRIRDSIALESVRALLCDHDFVAFDQDVFNRLYAGRCYEIDMAWNYIVLSTHQLVQCHNSAPEGIRRLYDKSAANIKAFHFLGAVKPWNNRQVPHSEQFWKYVSGSPFEEEIRRIPLNESKASDTGTGEGTFAWVLPVRSWRRLMVKFLLPCRGSPVERRFRRFLKWMRG